MRSSTQPCWWPVRRSLTTWVCELVTLWLVGAATAAFASGVAAASTVSMAVAATFVSFTTTVVGVITTTADQRSLSQLLRSALPLPLVVGLLTGAVSAANGAAAAGTVFSVLPWVAGALLAVLPAPRLPVYVPGRRRREKRPGQRPQPYA